MDFTIKKYAQILESAKEAGFQIMAMKDWLNSSRDLNNVFLIRHDVDRHPKRALAMAQMEAEMGVVSSYYFRIVDCSFKPEIIKKIAKLGHEIGYHYEDWFLAKYEKEKAINLYKKHLAKLRNIAPIKTIAMHGSPLAKESNLAIWEHYDLCDEGVEDVIKSADFSKFTFFTDTGRTFGQSKANLRDFVGSEVVFENVKSSDDLIDFLSHNTHNLVYFSIHPERWTDNIAAWFGQFIKDKAVNMIKLCLKFVRKIS